MEPVQGRVAASAVSGLIRSIRRHTHQPCGTLNVRKPPTLASQSAYENVLCGWLPHCKGDFQVWRVGRVQSSVRPVGAAAKGLLALMESANWVPFCFAGYDASDISRVVPVPGLTGLAITSPRSRNLLKLMSSAEL
jgi:hypothetical protein